MQLTAQDSGHASVSERVIQHRNPASIVYHRQECLRRTVMVGRCECVRPAEQIVEIRDGLHGMQQAVHRQIAPRALQRLQRNLSRSVAAFAEIVEVHTVARLVALHDLAHRRRGSSGYAYIDGVIE